MVWIIANKVVQLTIVVIVGCVITLEGGGGGARGGVRAERIRDSSVNKNAAEGAVVVATVAAFHQNRRGRMRFTPSDLNPDGHESDAASGHRFRTPTLSKRTYEVEEVIEDDRPRDEVRKVPRVYTETKFEASNSKQQVSAKTANSSTTTTTPTSSTTPTPSSSATARRKYGRISKGTTTPSSQKSSNQRTRPSRPPPASPLRSRHTTTTQRTLTKAPPAHAVRRTRVRQQSTTSPATVLARDSPKPMHDDQLRAKTRSGRKISNRAPERITLEIPTIQRSLAEPPIEETFQDTSETGHSFVQNTTTSTDPSAVLVSQKIETAKQRRKPVKSIVVSQQVSEVTSKRKIPARRRQSARNGDRSHKSMEEINESDNYPEHFKALLQARKQNKPQEMHQPHQQPNRESSSPWRPTTASDSSSASSSASSPEKVVTSSLAPQVEDVENELAEDRRPSVASSTTNPRRKFVPSRGIYSIRQNRLNLSTSSTTTKPVTRKAIKYSARYRNELLGRGLRTSTNGPVYLPTIPSTTPTTTTTTTVADSDARTNSISVNKASAPVKTTTAVVSLQEILRPRTHIQPIRLNVISKDFSDEDSQANDIVSTEEVNDVSVTPSDSYAQISLTDSFAEKTTPSGVTFSASTQSSTSQKTLVSILSTATTPQTTTVKISTSTDFTEASHSTENFERSTLFTSPERVITDQMATEDFLTTSIQPISSTTRRIRMTTTTTEVQTTQAVSTQPTTTTSESFAVNQIVDPELSAKLKSTKKPLTESQKKDLEELAKLEKQQSHLLDQLAFLTSLNFANTRSHSRNGGPQEDDLAKKIVAFAQQREKTSTTSPTEKTTSRRRPTKPRSTVQPTTTATRSVEEILSNLNITGLKYTTPITITSPYGQSNEAIIAAILKEQGIGPTTPTVLKDAYSKRPKKVTTTTSTARPRPLAQGFGWLLRALAPPPASNNPVTTKKPKPRKSTTSKPKSPTRSTQLSQEEMRKLLEQLEVLQKTGGDNGKPLDLSQIRNLDHLINFDQTTKRGPSETTTTTHRRKSTTTTTATTRRPSVLDNDLLPEFPEEPTTRRAARNRATLPPVRLNPVPGVSDEEPLIRGNLLSAAVNVTRAITQFLGSALQGAAASIQSMLASGSRGLPLSSSSSVIDN